jgi:hypothetical protein
MSGWIRAGKAGWGAIKGTKKNVGKKTATGNIIKAFKDKLSKVKADPDKKKEMIKGIHKFSKKYGLTSKDVAAGKWYPGKKK